MMEKGAAKRLILGLAVQAEIEGMKAENEVHKQYQGGNSFAYSEEDFRSKAEELRNIAYCHEQQL